MYIIPKTYPLRLPISLYERLEREAENLGRSVNKLMVEKLNGLNAPPTPTIEIATAKAIKGRLAKKIDPREPIYNSSGGVIITPKADWSPNSKCKHGWMNSFVCERNGGGCAR